LRIDTKPAPEYNPIFQRFYDPSLPPELQLESIVAYGLYKVAKREWASELWEREGRKPNEEDLRAYIATWTPSRIGGARDQAESIIGAYGASVIQDAAPGIREDALRGRFWQSVWPSMMAALLYTLILFAVAIALKFLGIDVLGIIEKIRT
jgi:hypothetical protein